MSDISTIRAVNKALHWSLENHPEVVIYGEDVGLPNGPFGATKGLHEKFGKRVFDTPISETAMIGAALGAAMVGMRPIVEIMYQDFALVAMDQFVNQVANARYVSNGAVTAPLVIRTQAGYSPGACAQHSHSLEAMFAHVPGLRVGLPSTPQATYDMLRSAVASEDPVLVIENRMLYPTKGPVDLDAPVKNLGGTRTVRTGDDVTIVSWSRMVHEAERAADSLDAQGISSSVLDLQWLNPLDLDPVFESVSHTGRLVVAHEANLTGGFGAEVVARTQAVCFTDLTAPIARVAMPDVPVPAAPALQDAVVPDHQDIVMAAMAACEPPVPARAQRSER